jgi:gas vesicle protein
MMKKFGSFLCGGLLGAFLAGLIVILVTPVTGAAMRNRIRDSFMNVRNEVKDAVVNRSTELRQELARLQKKELM